MNLINRTKELFEKYINRTASAEELEELFYLLKDKERFNYIRDIFKIEWDQLNLSLTLDSLSWEDMSAILQKKNNNNSQPSTNHVKKSPIRKMTPWLVAASLLTVIGVSAWLYYMHSGFEVYATGYGETKEIILSDNSRITLNANSEIKWTKDWKNAGVRVVELTGEAFFEVNRVSDHRSVENQENQNLVPFQVKTPDLTVNVLGTVFNVQSRREKTDVFLESGSVLLTLNEDRKDQNLSKVITEDSIYMAPGDWIRFENDNQSIIKGKSKTTLDQASWIEGSLFYENVALGEVLEDLKDIYGKEFEVVDTAILTRKVDLGLPYADWETLSGLMTLSLEIELIQKDNKVIIERKKGK